MDEPRVTKRAKKAHLSYELPHRIHCSCICPRTAPNGSTVIVYGHERGVRMVWRGGRPRKHQPSAPAPPASKPPNNDMIVISDDEDEQPQPPPHKAEIEYESKEDLQDPNGSWPCIIEDLDVDLGLDILHLATPDVPQKSSSFLQKTAIVAATDSEGVLRLINLPLSPPLAQEKRARVEQILKTSIELSAGRSIPRSVDVKLLEKTEGYLGPAWSKAQGGPAEVDLLVATVSENVNIWRFPVSWEDVARPRAPMTKSLHLPKPAVTVSFHPSTSEARILVAEASGTVRVYDPFANSGSEEMEIEERQPTAKLGGWLMAYHTSFQSAGDTCSSHPALAKRKKTLDAKWVLGGRAILALLEDGEWGIWDPSSAMQSGKNPEEFTLHGFLGSSSAPETTISKPKSVSKLAPMTPNTRKAKAENLFTGPTKVPGVASQGGISVVSSTPRGRQHDEAVVIHYNNTVYSVTSLQSFYQRSTSSSGGVGSLYSPGLTHLSDVNLSNENITSVDQFDARSTSSGLGQMNTQRDLLISGEHRFVVLQNLEQASQGQGLFARATEEAPSMRDQKMLEAGTLDLGGMDRMLSGMANGTGGGNASRRVGFAAQ
ncbi:hypothetical protein MBLNU230_g1371t1 [Neophaeotheca triangularis]